MISRPASAQSASVESVKNTAPFVVLSALFACSSGAADNATSGNSPHKTSQPANDEGSERQYPTKDSPLYVTPLQTPEDAAHTAQRERATDEQFEKYLDTQVRVVQASEKQARAAWTAALILLIETIIAGFALYFLRKTYGETRRTAFASMSTARASRKSAVLTGRAIDANRRPRLVVREMILTHLDERSLRQRL